MQRQEQLRNIRNSFYLSFRSAFKFEPNLGQKEVMIRLTEFIINDDDNQCFLLRGYAGTGKTTLIAALVNSLGLINYKSILLAPTGRAAKVMSNYSKKPAFTIHKKIYKTSDDGENRGQFMLAPNLYTNTLFIADEASMIGDASLVSGGGFGSRSLLEDLFDFVYSGVNCKLLLVGDNAQLPPVGFDDSPALNKSYLESCFRQKIIDVELTEVMRQAAESGILYNATNLRNQLSEEPELVNPAFECAQFKDVIRVDGSELEEYLYSAYNEFGDDETLVITRSNKRANLFNQQIRARIRWQESELNAGDLVMAVKNNYYWLPKESKAGFIANGDALQIVKVKKTIEMYGFNFAECIVKLSDYEDEASFECMVLMDTILSESPSLTNEEQKKLYNAVMEDLAHIPEKRLRIIELKKNPFFNALQIKFAYAVTCHKAQGGQWKAVFVEQGYITEETRNIEWLRWLYTAITRSSKKLYLVNFSEEFYK